LFVARSGLPTSRSGVDQARSSGRPAHLVDRVRGLGAHVRVRAPDGSGLSCQLDPEDLVLAA